MAFSRKFFASLPLIPFALLVFIHLFSSIGPFATPSQEACRNPELAAQQGIRTLYTGIGPFDGFLCFIVSFFKESLKTPVDFFIQVYLLTLFNTYIGIANIEGSRASFSKTIISWVTLYATLSQLFGVSVIVSLLWVPLFAYKSSSKLPLNYTVSPGRALAIPISLFLCLATIEYKMLFHSSREQENALAIFQIAPLLPAFAALLLTPLLNTIIPTTLSRSRTVVRTGYALIGLGNLAVHLYLVSYALEYQIGWADFRGLFDVPSTLSPSSRTFADSLEQANVLCSHFLLIDLIVLAIGMIYWAALETGVVSAILTLLGSFVAGPAVALTVYAAWREGKLESAEQDKKDA